MEPLTMKTPNSGNTLDLFVLAGQSNMQGFTSSALYYPPDNDNTDLNIPFWWVSAFSSNSGGQWTHLQKQGGRFPEGHFGPEVTLARRLFLQGYRPAIFKFCAQSTSLAEYWRHPGEGGLYDVLIRSLITAMRQLEANGSSIRYQATIWVHGESDAKVKKDAIAYKSHLSQLFSHYRKRIPGADGGVFVLSVDEDHPYCKINTEVVRAHLELCAENKDFIWSSMKGLEKYDETHLTANGVNAQGMRLYSSFLSAAEKRRVI